MNMPTLRHHLQAIGTVAVLALCAGSGPAQALTVAQSPLFGGSEVAPLTMLVMGNDHTLFYQAYNDASDLNGDGLLNVGYEPDKVDYYGYFDSFLCYTYNATQRRFNPVGTTTRENLKRCPGQWSGDFLNYLTTSRIDALRKVLYGGTRVVDTANLTVLERAHIPQDAHSWGKEYFNPQHDGYDIRDYSPLPLPAPGTRHLFANTTLLERAPNPEELWGREPRLRVLRNSRFRVWNWVAKERPVAGATCDDNGNHNASCTYGAFTQNAPTVNSSGDFNAALTNWGVPENRCGSAPIAGGNINTTGQNNNPFVGAGFPAFCSHDRYLTQIRGQIQIPTTGQYQFVANGDDAVEFRLNGQPLAWWHGGHGAAGGTPAQIANTVSQQGAARVGIVTLQAGWYDFEFLHQELAGSDSYQLLWLPPNGSWQIVPANRLRGPNGQGVPIITTWNQRRDFPASTMEDYIVRVRVCHPDFPDANCKRYPSGALKPTGLLHDYGENDQMFFGLISGSSTHPFTMRGGLLRKNIESFRNEINPLTGQFLPVAGIVQTIDRFRIVDFGVDVYFHYRGGWLTNQPMSASGAPAFPDWGNPLAEMMYEAVRYFAGGGRAPTNQFFNRGNLLNVAGQLFERVQLRDISTQTFNLLPAPNWLDPYTRVDAPRPWCAPGAKLLISDVNPSFDSQFVPGSAFSNFAGDLPGLNVSNEVDAIWAAEYGGTRDVFIGQVGSFADSAPSVKSVSGMSNIRGLAPSEPTREGSFYSAGVARFAYRNDLRPDLPGRQNIQTFSVALASPLPQIELPTPVGPVRVVPFAKSIGGAGISNVKGDFQPTNTIVDFFVETFANTDPNGSDANPNLNGGRPYIVFRINFEDVEQGADHDMDAIVRYELRLNSDNTVTINLNTEYQAGGIQHAMGYVISGTTQDGVYLEVADEPHPNNPPYFLNTPPGRPPGWCDRPDGNLPEACRLPLSASRTFTPDPNAERALLLNSPLWYAAKYGADGNADLAPGETPDNYFLVTNASTLPDKLRAAFARILLLGARTGVSVTSTRLSTGDLAFSAEFDSNGWIGDLVALKPIPDGDDVVEWRASNRLPQHTQRRIFTWDPGATGAQRGREFREGSALSAATRATIGTLTVGNRVFTTDELINFIRGDRSLEGGNDGLRARRSVLADIVNSTPVFSGRGNEGWVRLGGAVGEAYATHIENRKNQVPIVLVGSNGGMLHAFDARPAAQGGGRELWAYVPSVVHGNLKNLARPNYSHQYFVDGQIRVADAYLNGQWRRIAVGTTGAGGPGVFALDVTNPTAFDTSNVLWEFSDPDLGATIGQPLITRLENGTPGGQWVAIFANGFGSPNHRAVLYVVDLATGELLRSGQNVTGKITLSTGTAANPNGLASPGLWIDPNTRTAASRVYAGDLHGNIWRVDFVQSANDRAPGPLPIRPFNAAGTSTAPLFNLGRRITSAPTIAAHPTGGLMVFVGTGSFFAEGDQIVPPVNAPIDVFAALRDSRMQRQGQNSFPQPIPNNAEIARMRLDGERRFVNYGNGSGLDGWILDLATATARRGERVLTRPNVIGGRVFFTTYEPSADPCEGGGRNFFYTADAIQAVAGQQFGVGQGQSLVTGAPLITPIVITDPEPVPEPTPPGGGSGPGTVPSYTRPPQESWCRRVSVLVPNAQGVLVPQTISTICDGRQRWRQQF